MRGDGEAHGLEWVVVSLLVMEMEKVGTGGLKVSSEITD
jgi:hypothetical protein